jgi:hypothetical protein
MKRLEGVRKVGDDFLKLGLEGFTRDKKRRKEQGVESNRWKGPVRRVLCVLEEQNGSQCGWKPRVGKMQQKGVGRKQRPDYTGFWFVS